MWIDSDSTYEDDTFNASISAITYTQTQDILSYTLSFDLEDKATWTTDTCKSSDGYTINGTKCEKTMGVNESYGNLPSVTINGEDVLWYSDNKLFNNKATTDTKYTMRQNTIYKSIPNSALASHTFNYTGNEQIFTAPVAGTYKLETWGAQGGSYSTTYYGGYGGYATGTVFLYTSSSLYVIVGGAGSWCSGNNCIGNGGYNGGGYCKSYSDSNSMCGGGGGATHIAKSRGLLSEEPLDIIIVAGGGGGANYCNDWNYAGGGSGGGITGVAAVNIGAPHFTNNGGLDAIGGTQTSGAAFGMGSSTNKDGSGPIYVGGGGGFYGGIGSSINGAGGGSGYLGNQLLTNKSMYCYNCTTSSEESTKTFTTTCHSSTPTENCAKEGNGYARITFYK